MYSPYIRLRSAAEFCKRHVLVFGSHERPDFVTLNATAMQVAEYAILILGRDRASLNQELRYGVLGNARHPDVARMLAPSTRQRITGARVAESSLFSHED